MLDMEEARLEDDDPRLDIEGLEVSCEPWPVTIAEGGLRGGRLLMLFVVSAKLV